VHVFEMGGGGAHAELHVAVQPDLPVVQQGAAASIMWPFAVAMLTTTRGLIA
jgi:hypothetical protein